MKAKADRAQVIQKALDMERNPAKYNRATSYGAAKYLKNLTFDKKTGEVFPDLVGRAHARALRAVREPPRTPCTIPRTGIDRHFYGSIYYIEML